MNHHRRDALNSRHQDGIALIMGLLLLIVMSLIGVSMMSSTSLETMMAGGARESNIAFQAAEAGLRDAEARIQAATAIAIDFDGATPGLLSETDTEPDYFDPDTWDTTSSQMYSANYPEILPDEQPRYIVKHLGDVANAATVGQAISMGGYGQQAGGRPVSIFRITARATSRDGSATTILQSHYGRAFP